MTPDKLWSRVPCDASAVATHGCVQPFKPATRFQSGEVYSPTVCKGTGFVQHAHCVAEIVGGGGGGGPPRGCPISERMCLDNFLFCVIRCMRTTQETTITLQLDPPGLEPSCPLRSGGF